MSKPALITSSIIQSKMVIGVDNMEQDEILNSVRKVSADKNPLDPDKKKDEATPQSEAESQIMEMHRLVVPQLLPKMLERWKKTEQSNKRFIFFHYDDRGLIHSMVSGIIYLKDSDGKDQKAGKTLSGNSSTILIINTATRPEFRRNGVLEHTIYGLVEYLNSEKFADLIKSEQVDLPQLKIAKIAGSLGFPAAELASALSPDRQKNAEYLREINSQVKNLFFKKKLLTDPTQITKTDLELQKACSEMAPETQALWTRIASSSKWEQTNFLMMTKLMSQFADTAETSFELGSDSPVILCPSLTNNREIAKLCADKMAQWDWDLVQAAIRMTDFLEEMSPKTSISTPVVQPVVASAEKSVEI